MSQIAMAIGVALPAAQGRQPTTDARNVEHGHPLPMPENYQYADQPYPVVLDDGRWLVLMTVGTKGEVKGSKNYTISTVSSDMGQTWSEPVYATQTYAVPLKNHAGRIYALRPSNYTWSDDGGQSWSDPLKTGAPDGDVGWNVGMPLTIGDEVWVPWAEWKGGKETMVHFNYSPNIMTETDPAKVEWEQIATLKGPDWDQGDNVSEEPHLAVLSDGTFYCVFRTDQGHIAYATSKDRGRNWSETRKVTYADGERTIKNPRACPSLWTCSNGKFLLWHHNHGGKNYSDRNPAWLSGGIERNGDILWSEPEPVLYSDRLDYHHGRLSYPGFLEVDGRYFIFETTKTRAGVHEVGADFLETLWGQFDSDEIAQEGQVLDLDAEALKGQDSVEVAQVPSLQRGMGFAIDLWLKFDSLEPGQLILDNRNDEGRGIVLHMVEGGALRLEMSDGQTVSAWQSDPGRLTAGRHHHVVVTVDGGPKTIFFVIDGTLCDGGEERQFGWGRFNASMGDVKGAGTLHLGPSLEGSIERLRLYDRYLMVSEAVAHSRVAP